MKARRMRPGECPPKGHTVTLFRGALDSRARISWFETDGSWTCPETVNGHWYGVTSPDEIAAMNAQWETGS